jgi:ubiquinone/menaquinone biosynthesis C-methylase UbiE
LFDHGDYYKKFYTDAQRQGLQGFGNDMAGNSLLKKVLNYKQGDILELGAGSGEFTRTVLSKEKFKSYLALDIRLGAANIDLLREIEDSHSKDHGNDEFSFVEGDAQKLDFPDDKFDLVFSTCLLAHVNDPEAVISEAIRVTKSGGSVLFLAPTDPGFANQTVKNIWTYPMLRKRGDSNPEYSYAKEHKNPIHNIIAIAKILSKPHSLRIHYRPFFFSSWNFNLWTVIQITKLAT